jgi:cytochrome c556
VPYDKAAVTADVYVLDVASRLPWVTFAKGTEGQGGGALDDIWKVAARFLKTQARLRASLKQLTVSTVSGELAKLRAPVGDTRAGCKACHNAFRK